MLLGPYSFSPPCLAGPGTYRGVGEVASCVRCGYRPLKTYFAYFAYFAVKSRYTGRFSFAFRKSLFSRAM